MRTLLITVVTCLLAWGVWSIMQAPEAPETPLEEPNFDPPPTLPTDEEERLSDRAKLKTGTLVVSVRTPGGDAPPGARAGYLYAGASRLKPLSKAGEARFTDAPLGTLTVVARAPGYAELQVRRAVMAGLRSDVLMVLRREKR